MQEYQCLAFIINEKLDFPVWSAVFPHTCVSRIDLIGEDLRLLGFLLLPNVLLDIIHDYDSSGMTAIHWAWRYGNSESVKLLLQKGAQVIQEARKSQSFAIATPDTATPLEFFEHSRASPPDSVVMGGDEELKLWKEDRNALEKLLLEHAVHPGKLWISVENIYEANPHDKASLETWTSQVQGNVSYHKH